MLIGRRPGLLLANTAGVPVAHLIEDVRVRCGGRALAKDPWVAHDLLGVQPCVGIGDKQLADEVFRFS